MVQLTEEVKKLIGEVKPAMIATVSLNGKPNISPKGSFRVLDNEHVGFVDVASPRTITNLKENPHITAIVFDQATSKGCRIWGEAEILNNGDLFNAISAEFNARKMKINHLVKIKVEEVETF